MADATVNGDQDYQAGYRAAVGDALAEINVLHQQALVERDTDRLRPQEHKLVARYLAAVNARVVALTPYKALPTSKPRVRLIGTDGNVFALAGKVVAALKVARQPALAQEFRNKLLTCHSYDEALVLMQQYVEVE